MSGRCKDCRHWQFPTYDGWPPEHGICRKISGDETDLDSLAMATCMGEGISGELLTLAAFGCVLFEEKEST